MADSTRKTGNLCTGYTTPNSQFNIYIENLKTIVDTVQNFTLSFDSEITYAGNTLYLITDGGNIVLGYVAGTGHVVKSFSFNSTQVEAIKSSTNPYIRLYVNGADMSGNTKVMLNTGSSPLPYEPYGWLHSLRKLTTSTDTITTLPTDLYADGNNATVGLVGNMQQTGTPTPQNPIQPSECGDRTANEWNVTILSNSSISAENYWEKYDSSTVTTTMYMSCEANTTYYLYTPSSITSGIFRVYTSTSDTIPTLGNSILIQEKTRSSAPVSLFKFTTGVNDKLIVVQVTTANSQTMADDAVLDKGYKIPISSANTTTPVYLGEVETTRKIKKYEFTGSETWKVGSENFYSLVPETSGDGVPYSSVICSHCSGSTINSTGKAVFVKKSEFPNITTGAELKQFCADQYAAGTPVCIWYVLATEETGIVNEPLRKIGDYADTVSGISIPTITGKDTFDVLTTLKPSEVSLSYTGWHDASVGEWDGSDWQ